MNMQSHHFKPLIHALQPMAVVFLFVYCSGRAHQGWSNR